MEAESALRNALAELKTIHALLDEYESTGDKSHISEVSQRMKKMLPQIKDMSLRPEYKTKKNAPLLIELSNGMKEAVTRTKLLGKQGPRAGIASKPKSTATTSEPPPPLKGFLMKQGVGWGGSGWKKRWFAQKGNVLEYFANEGDVSPKGSIDLTLVSEIQTQSRGFDLVTPGRVYKLQVPVKSKDTDLSYWNVGLVNWKKWYDEHGRLSSDGAAEDPRARAASHSFESASIASTEAVGRAVASSRPHRSTMDVSSGSLPSGAVYGGGGRRSSLGSASLVRPGAVAVGGGNDDDVAVYQSAPLASLATSKDEKESAMIQEEILRRRDEERLRVQQEKERDEAMRITRAKIQREEEERQRAEREKERVRMEAAEEHLRQVAEKEEAERKEAEENRRRKEEELERAREEELRRLKLQLEEKQREADAKKRADEEQRRKEEAERKAREIAAAKEREAERIRQREREKEKERVRRDEERRKQVAAQVINRELSHHEKIRALQEQLRSVEERIRGRATTPSRPPLPMVATSAPAAETKRWDSPSGDGKMVLEHGAAPSRVLAEAAPSTHHDEESSSVVTPNPFSDGSSMDTTHGERSEGDMLDDMLNRLRATERHLTDREDAMAKLKSEHRVAREQLEAKELELVAVKEELETLEGELRERDVMLARSRDERRLSSVGSGGDSVAKLRETIHAHQAHNRLLQSEIQRVEREKESEVAAKNCSIEALSEELEKTRKDYQRLRKEMLVKEDGGSVFETELKELRQDYFFALATGIKLNFTLQGIPCNVNIAPLYEQARIQEVPRERWNVWIMEQLDL